MTPWRNPYSDSWQCPTEVLPLTRRCGQQQHGEAGRGTGARGRGHTPARPLKLTEICRDENIRNAGAISGDFDPRDTDTRERDDGIQDREEQWLAIGRGPIANKLPVSPWSLTRATVMVRGARTGIGTREIERMIEVPTIH